MKKIFIRGFVSIIVLIIAFVSYGYFKAQSLANRGMLNTLSYNMVIVEMNPISAIGFDIFVEISDRRSQAIAFAQISEEYNTKPPVMDFYGNNMPVFDGLTADIEPKSFVFELDFGFGKDIADQIKPEITDRLPEIKKIIEDYLSSKNKEDLSYENEEYLKLQIKEKINRILEYGPIEMIIITKKEIN